MRELTQERSLIHANIVISALTHYNIVRDMNELAQE